MTMRDYSSVAPTIWRNQRFARLDGDGKLLLLYFFTSPHVGSAGVSTIPDSYAAHDLGWTVEQYEAKRNALAAAGLVTFDEATDEVYVHGWFKIPPNVPTNSNHAKGTRKRISAVESDAVRERAETEFTDDAGAHDKLPEPEPQPDNLSHLLKTNLMRKGITGTR